MRELRIASIDTCTLPSVLFLKPHRHGKSAGHLAMGLGLREVPRAIDYIYSRSSPATSPTGPDWDAAERLLALKHPPLPPSSPATTTWHRRWYRSRTAGGSDVPRDLSVVGFDDTSAATMVWPELTTIHQPIAAMADAAIDILLRQVRNTSRPARAVVNHIVPHQLIKRDSVA